MLDLVKPSHATPASDDQRHAIRDAYRVLGGALNPRRATTARSVHVDQLDAGGFDRDLLCWLSFQGHLHHFHEASRRGAPYLRAVESVVPGPKSCFSLTPAGLAFAARLLGVGRAGDHIALPMGDLTPRYDSAERVLTWGAYQLKRYRQRQGNQEAFLTAAEELQWIKWFDDPLPRPKGVNSKLRLHNTINDLNRRQILHLVQFHANGAGTQIGWELR